MIVGAVGSAVSVAGSVVFVMGVAVAAAVASSARERRRTFCCVYRDGGRRERVWGTRMKMESIVWCR